MVENSHGHTSTKFIIPILLVTLVLACALLLVSTKPAYADTIGSPEGQLPDNTECLLCHSQEGQTWTLPGGEALSVTIDPGHFGDGMHATVSCQVCHSNISGYPHPANTAQTIRDYTLQYKGLCENCHDVQATELMDSAHTKLFEAGNTNAPTCADCHNPHSDTTFGKDANGKLLPAEHARIANICANCHSSIFEQYAQSVHGAGVFVEKNPDVPSCTDCHGVHTITGPSGEPGFRLTSPNICAKCHTDAAIMDQYGISTDVLQTYIADFHGTTVTLFEKTDPDQLTNMPVCYDCHGVHDIRSADDPEKGLQVKENLLVACQRCHPDATSNFPDAWLSHYIPAPDKYPLVYYVELAYKILIPLVLGAMAVFILTDIYRKVVLNRRKRSGGTEDPTPPVSQESK